MRNKHHHAGTHRTLASVAVLIAATLAIILFSQLFASHHQASSEMRFTDASHSGLAIVPASGGSTPSGCGAGTLNDQCPCALPWGGSTPNATGVTAYQSPSVPYGSSCVSEVRSCSNTVLSGSYTYASCSVAAAANCTAPWGSAVNHGSAVTAYQSASVAYGSSCVSESRSCSNGALSGSYVNQSCSVAAPASCTFNGSTVPHGFSVTAYQTATVSYGNTCAAETRTCSNGTLSGAYAYNACSVVANCSVTPPYSTDNGGFVLTSGAGYYFINKFGLAFCVSNTRGSSYFIPAATVAELTTFYNAAPGISGVTRIAP